MQRSTIPPSRGVLPNFGPRRGVPYPHYSAISIPAAALHRLGEKIVRGITYLATTGSLIDQRYLIETHVVEDANIEVVAIDAFVASKGVQYARGPGIAVTRAPAVDDPLIALFHIEIWGRLRLRASVVPRATRDSTGV
jgi:hypothetical protein